MTAQQDIKLYDLSLRVSGLKALFFGVFFMQYPHTTAVKITPAVMLACWAAQHAAAVSSLWWGACLRPS